MTARYRCGERVFLRLYPQWALYLAQDVTLANKPRCAGVQTTYRLKLQWVILFLKIGFPTTSNISQLKCPIRECQYSLHMPEQIAERIVCR